MIRGIVGVALTFAATSARAQYPALPLAPPVLTPAPMMPPMVAPPPYSPYGPGLGMGMGLGMGFGLPYSPYGYARYSFRARGYYPPNPYGGTGWLPPNAPSPYYVIQRGADYLRQVEQQDRMTYGEIELDHALGKR